MWLSPAAGLRCRDVASLLLLSLVSAVTYMHIDGRLRVRSVAAAY